MKLDKYYEDLSVQHVGTEKTRAYYMPLDRNGKETSLLLSGEDWFVHVYPSPEDAEDSFISPDFDKTQFDQIPVLIVLADARTGEEQVVPLFLNQGFILGSISHRLLLFRVFKGFADLLLDFGGEFRVVFQEVLDGVTTLTDLSVSV